MDSDLSVSGISEDDDSQLRRIAELDTTANDLCSKSNFTSPTMRLKVSTDPATPSCSSFMDGSNKEDVSTSNSEVQKLSLEPLQMKRKKTGGYNLRKSLAWNKAFFTDEGVLDPNELSMISGTFASASGGGLCSIKERRTPQSSNSLRNVASSPLKYIKKNMCKEISATSSNEDKEKGNVFFQSSRKVFGTRNGKTSSTGGVCPRPLFSTPLKRPANINISKAAIKESKIPKFQVSKLGACSTTKTSKSTMHGASPMQNKKISFPVSIQRKHGLRSSFRNAINGQNKAKDDSIPPDLSRASHSKGDADTSTLNLNLANSSSLLPIRKNDSTSLKVKPNPVVEHSSVCSSQDRDGSAPPAVSLPSNTFTSARSMQHTQIQTMKPSGLRMPSPSLGFFCQSKASETNSLSQRNAVSSVQNLQKSGDLRPPRAMGDQKINDTTAVMKSRGISTRLECSGASDSQKGIKPCFDDGNALHTSLKVQCDSNNPKLVSDKVKVNDHGEEVRSEGIMSQQDTESWMNGKELLDTREYGQTLEEDDPKVIDSQGSRGSSSSGLDDYQLVSQRDSQGNALCTSLKIQRDSKNPKLVSDEGKVNDHVEEVRNERITSQQDTESWMNGRELLNTGECGQTLEEDDPKVIDSQGCRGSSSSGLEDYQLDSQQNCTTHTMDTFRMDTAVNNSAEVEMKSNSLVSFDGSFSDFASGNTNICSGEETMSYSPASGMQDARGLPEEQSDHKSCAFEDDQILSGHNYATVTEHCLSKFSTELRNHGSKDSADPDLIGLICTKVEAENSAFPTEDLHVLSLKENVTTNEGSDKSDLGGSVHHTSKQILSAQSCKNIIHECLMGEEAKEERASKTVSSIELNGKDTADFDGFDIQSEQTTSGIEPDMISGQFSQDDVLLHPGQDESLDVLDKATLHPKFALSCHETLKLVVSGIPESLNGSIGLNKVHALKKCSPNKCSQIVKMNDSELLEDSQTCDLVDFSENVGQKNHPIYRSNGSSKGGVAHSESLDGKTSAELCSIVSSSSSCVHHCSTISAEKLEQLDKPAHYHILPGRSTGTVSEESDRSQFLDNIPELSDVCGSDAVSSSSFNFSEPPMGEIDSKTNSFDVGICIEDKPSNHVGNDSLPDHNILGDESEMMTSATSNSHASELSIELDNAKCFTYNENAVVSIKRPEDGKMKSNLLVIPPQNAVPFSDEWLAAIEAAGEDILTMKGGAVQNSPPQKPVPEPNPWSPLKKKNNQTGPFDCTKYTHSFS